MEFKNQLSRNILDTYKFPESLTKSQLATGQRIHLCGIVNINLLKEVRIWGLLM
ncbi:Hypothetical protein CINCED_3A024626 [Cinara cedri]|uniref:Uncharacterized protein n=1 Tax=Cinara cedri TaxID=506608 RepID=A0A5E4MTD5_9HEMI|nr:Hypothetical protein CINCED_3A024626 [Cinara cedri]